MPVRTNENGEFIVKKWAALVGLVVLLLSLGYSFAMTFEIGPIKERLDKVEAIEELNRTLCLKMEVHFEYIRAELEKMNQRQKP
jgi:hypothetical protein